MRWTSSGVSGVMAMATSRGAKGRRILAWALTFLQIRRVAPRGPRHPHYRRPKIAVPIRTWLAPSSIATSKSSLIPIESQPGKPAHSGRSASSSRSSRSCRNQDREASAGPPRGGMAIRPRIFRWCNPASGATVSAKSASGKPCLVSSPARLTSRKPAISTPRRAASASTAWAIFGRSIEWMVRKRSSAGRTLFDCSGPIRCHSVSRGRCGTFSAASWTRFSPNRWRPASHASRSVSGGWVLVTPTRVRSARRRPARAQADAMRRSTSARRSATPLTVALGGGLFDHENPLAAVALDQAPLVADLDHDLRADAIVAGAAVPFDLAAAHFLEPAHHRHAASGIALANPFEEGEDAFRQLAAKLFDLLADRLRLARDARFLALPLGELCGVALVDLAEALPQLLELARLRFDALDRREALRLAGRDLTLDRVDLLEESAVLALVGDSVDLLLVPLELLLGVLNGGVRFQALLSGLLDGFLCCGDLDLARGVLLVQLAHPFGDFVEASFGVLQVVQGAL